MLSFSPYLPLRPTNALRIDAAICTDLPRRSKRYIPPAQSPWRSQQTLSSAEDPQEPVLEGDLLIFRERNNASPSEAPAPPWKVAACTGSFRDSVQLCPVRARSVDDHGNWELFVEEEHLLDLPFQPLSHLHVRFVEADYEMRVIENRIINPHGEESEHCWRVDPEAIAQLPIVIHPPPSTSDFSA